MSDLIEIGIVVDSKPVNNLVAALGKASNAADLADKNFRSLEKALKQGIGGGADNLLKAFSRLERAGMSLSDVNKGLAQDAKMLAQANQAQVNSLLNVDKASKSARNSAEAMKQAFREQAAEQKKVAIEQKRVEQAARENTLALNRMRAAYDGSFAAEQRTIELKRRLRQEIASGTMTVRQAGAELLKYRTYMQQFNLSQMAATKGNNRMGVVVQQTGYQVGDFLVQVQGGTNFLVAFGQQATQLVGVLPLIAPQLGLTTAAAIGLSTALGIGIPLMTAVGAALMRTRGETKSAEDQLNDYTKILGQYSGQAKIAASSTQELTEEFGSQADNIRGLAKALTDIRRLEALDALNKSLEQVATTLSVGWIDGLRGFANNSSGTLRKVKHEFDLTDEAAQALVNSFSSFSEAEGIEGAVPAAVALHKTLMDVFGAAENIPPELREAFTNAALLAQEAAKVVSAAETIEEKIKRISREIESATKFKLSDVFDAASRAIDGMNSRLGVTLSQLGGIMSSINSVLVDTVSVQAESEALAAGASASAAANAARIAREVATLTGGGTAEDLTLTQAAAITALTKALDENATAADKLKAQQDALRDSAKGSKKELNGLQKEIDKLNKTAAQGLTPFDKYNKAIAHLNVLRAAGLRDAAYSMEIERLNDELAKSLPMVNDVADAFGDFLARGLTDFKSFANSIFKSFQNMLAQMIATAARNRILISMGATGSAAGTAASAGVGSAIGSSIGTLASGAVSVGSNLAAAGTTALGLGGAFTGSFGAGLGATMTGGLAGGASAFATGAGMMGTAGTAMSGFAMAAGAAIPVIAALALVVGLFSKKVSTSLKEINSGVSGIVKGFDVAIKNFSVIEKTVTTSRFFGLSKKTRVTSETITKGAPDSPLIAAVAEVQQSVLTAAEAFGFGADAFKDFSYEFKLSLMGLSDDQKVQKINEELTRMGDAFADMLPHFSNMNELLEAAEHRFQIENRLLTLQGKEAEVVARNREREMEATHALNRGLLQMVYSLEDAADAMQSMVQGTVDEISEQIGASRRLADQARQSADAYRSAAESLRDSASLVGDRSIAQLSTTFASLLAKSLDGDLDAMGALGGAGASLATASQGTASTAIELSRIEAGIRNQLSQAAAVADVTALGADYQAMLFDVNTAALEVLQDMLRSGNVTQEMLQEQIDVLGRINKLIGDSSELEIRTAKDASGNITTGLVDNGGRVVAGLSSETARQIRAIESSSGATITKITEAVTSATQQQIDAIDRNGDGLISKTEVETAKLLRKNSSLVNAINSASIKNANMTTAELRKSLAGKASDATINSVIKAVDHNKDGIITAEERLSADQILSVSKSTLDQIDAVTKQNLVIKNSTTGQTTSLNNTQKLTTKEVDTVATLQDETISITELVKRATDNHATLTRALLNSLLDGIPLTGIDDLVSGNNRIVSRLDTIANLMQKEANEALRLKELNSLQEKLESAVGTKTSAEGKIVSTISSIRDLERSTGGRIENNRGGAARLGQNDQGRVEFDGAWVMGSGAAHAAFRAKFWNKGGLQDQLFAADKEVAKALRDIESQRDAIRALGGVPAFARGGLHSGGMALVGEEGPELVNMGPSRVFNANQTKDIMKGDSDSAGTEIRTLRQELKELRRVMVENLKHTKRTSDTLRTWDGQGLPEERVV